jgi:hypothetical protein
LFPLHFWAVDSTPLSSVYITYILILYVAPTSVVGAGKKTSATAKPRPHTTTSAKLNSHSGALPSNVMTASTVLSKALTTPRHIPLMQIPDQAPASPTPNGVGEWCICQRVLKYRRRLWRWWCLLSFIIILRHQILRDASEGTIGVSV